MSDHTHLFLLHNLDLTLVPIDWRQAKLFILILNLWCGDPISSLGHLFISLDALRNHGVFKHFENLLIVCIGLTAFIIVRALLHIHFLPKRILVELFFFWRFEKRGPWHQLLSLLLSPPDDSCSLFLHFINDAFQTSRKSCPILISNDTSEIVTSRVIWQIKMHVPQVITPVLFIEFFFQSNDQVVVFDWICNLQKFTWNYFIFKEIRNLRPVIIMLIFKWLASLALVNLLAQRRKHVSLRYISRLSIVNFLWLIFVFYLSLPRHLNLLKLPSCRSGIRVRTCLVYISTANNARLYIVFGSRNVILKQRVIKWGWKVRTRLLRSLTFEKSIGLIDAPAYHLRRLFHCLSRMHDLYLLLSSFLGNLSNFACFVDPATLLLNTRLVIEDVYVNNVIFMELLRPSLGNSVLYFLFQNVFVWTLRQCLLHTLFMQLVKLIVEFSNHLLDVLRLLLLIKFVNYCLLKVQFSKANHLALGSNL